MHAYLCVYYFASNIALCIAMLLCCCAVVHKTVTKEASLILLFSGKHCFEPLKASYSKSFHNKSRCSNTVKFFVTMTIINILVFLKSSYSATLAKHPVYGSDFVLRGEYNKQSYQ